MKRLLGALFATALVFSLVACKDETTNGDTSKVDDAVEVIVAKDKDIESFDHHSITAGTDMEMIATFVEGLYSLDENSAPIPAMATGHTVSEDGLTYTFTLRDAKWSNGDPVTADDFVYAWRRLAKQGEYRSILTSAQIKNAAEITSKSTITDADLETLGIKNVDGKVVIELEKEVPWLLQLTSFVPLMPMNETFVEAQGDDYGKTPENLLSNGPYKMVERRAGISYKFEKNENYWDASAVNVDVLEFKIFKDAQTAAIEFEAGKVDVVKLSSELTANYKDSDSFYPIPAGYTWFIAPNHRKPDGALASEELRLAIAKAFDKVHIANTILADGSRPADYIVPWGLAANEDGDFRVASGKYLENDVAEAQGHWEAWKAESGQSSLTLELLFEDASDITAIAEFLQSEIEANLDGLTIELKKVIKKERLDTMKLEPHDDWDMALTRWGPDYADPLTYLEDLFHSEWIPNLKNDGTYTPGFNYWAYNSSAYDSLIELVRPGGASTDRWEDMVATEAQLMSEAGVMPIFQRGYSLLVNPDLSGLQDNVVGTPFIYKNLSLK